MKPLSKSFIVLLAAMLFLCDLSAQSRSSTPTVNPQYRTALGIRAGRTSGITIKQFVNQNFAAEGIIGFWTNALGFTGLLEKHMPVWFEGMKFYYGGGGHFTYETGRYYYRRYNNPTGDYVYRYGPHGFAIGIDGVAGLDYKIGAIPLALSIEVKPLLEMSNYGVIFTALDAGVGIKITF
jgi:hypothetical protein